MKIEKAKANQAEEISNVTKEAFKIYRAALPVNAEIQLSALTETVADILADISKNTVLVAVEDGCVIGAIRVEALSKDLAYISRFAVDPNETNGGVGGELLAEAVKLCVENGFSAVTLHTYSKYYKLARYYYGKEFYVHSTNIKKGYIRALFVKELNGKNVDLSPAFNK